MKQSDYLIKGKRRYAVAFVLSCLVMIILLPVSLPESDAQEDPKIALVVLDGADWKVIEDLIEEDRLPEFKNAKEKGVYGELHTKESFSPVTFTKMSTGRDAENIGVEGWNAEGEQGRRLIQSTDVENYRIWNYLTMHGIESGVVSYFLTWPVEEIKGFMISGTLARDDNIVYPEGYFEEEEVLGDGDEWEKSQYVVENYKDEVDFLTVGSKRLDGIQHHLWKFVDPEPFGLEMRDEHEEYREIVYTEYENLDSTLKEFDDEWNVMVVSSSGFQPQGKLANDSNPINTFKMNELLAELGYTEYEIEESYGQNIMRVDQEESQLQEGHFEYPLIPEINSTTYRFKFEILDENLDEDKVVDELNSITYKDGEDFFYDVRVEDSSIRGRFHAPQDRAEKSRAVEDNINHPTIRNPLTHLQNAFRLDMPDGEEYLFWSAAEQTGDHPPGTHGVFIAYGPDIASTGEFDTGEIRDKDIAPTLLYAYDVPVPRDMEGRPVQKIFTEEFNQDREVVYSNMSTKKEDEQAPEDADILNEKAIRERLRILGYNP